MIELSVSLPMYRAKHIGWLALEDLIRQEDIDFEWELVVAEEPHHSFGESSIMTYKDRLMDVGCVRIKYIPMVEWKPLTIKLLYMIDNMSPDSRVWVGHAADNFHPPKQLKAQYDAFNEDIHWFASTKVIFYDILTEATVLFDTDLGERKDDSYGKAISMDIMRQTPPSNKLCSSDVLTWDNVPRRAAHKFAYPEIMRMAFDESDNWKYGLATYRLNNFSKRNKCFTQETERIRECPVDINYTIPPYILDRLKDCKEFTADHAKYINFSTNRPS